MALPAGAAQLELQATCSGMRSPGQSGGGGPGHPAALGVVCKDSGSTVTSDSGFGLLVSAVSVGILWLLDDPIAHTALGVTMSAQLLMSG